MKINPKQQKEIIDAVTAAVTKEVCTEIVKLLTVELTVETQKPGSDGTMPSVPVQKHESWYLPNLLVRLISHYEASHRDYAKSLQRLDERMSHVEATTADLFEGFNSRFDSFIKGMNGVYNAILSIKNPIKAIIHKAKQIEGK